MTLCDDCIVAERDPHGIAQTWLGRLCCQAREVAIAPRCRMAAAYSAAIAGLDETRAAWLRDRAYALIRAAKERA